MLLKWRRIRTKHKSRCSRKAAAIKNNKFRPHLGTTQSGKRAGVSFCKVFFRLFDSGSQKKEQKGSTCSKYRHNGFACPLGRRKKGFFGFVLLHGWEQHFPLFGHHSTPYSVRTMLSQRWVSEIRAVDFTASATLEWEANAVLPRCRWAVALLWNALSYC